jgi:pimeloyl-ACP methyl ester carboxylesterase
MPLRVTPRSMSQRGIRPHLSRSLIDMTTLQELRAVGMATLQLPHVLRRRGCGSTQYVAERNARFPVLLVHGCAATEAMGTPLRCALAEAGCGHIVGLTYNPFATDPEAVSAELTNQALRALAAMGAPRVHLVSHSLGGLIVRCALAGSAALSSQTGCAVTIASPHCGAYLARIAPGRCARIMHLGPRLRLPESIRCGRSAGWPTIPRATVSSPRRPRGSMIRATARPTC